MALAVLVLEICLTRVFSFIMFHHFTYLVIGTAMLGFGAAGTYLTLRRATIGPGDDTAFLARSASRTGLSTVAAILLIPRIHFFPMDIYDQHDFSNLISLAVIVLLAGAPFYFAGQFVVQTLTQAGPAIHRLYFVDLCGAATGCFAALGLINSVGAVAACFAVAAIAWMVSLFMRFSRPRLAGLVLSLGAMFVQGRTEYLPLYAPTHKQLHGLQHAVELIKWHVVTRLDVTHPLHDNHSFGGALSPRYTGEPQTLRLVFQDASALTGIIQPTSTPRDTESLGYYLQGAPYIVHPRGDALVIGCGGGVDVLVALHHGARHVTGVDLNPHVIDMLRDRYSRFAGGVFERSREDVELVVAEGRHFLSRDPRRFEVIQLSGVDTFSALSTGAYALSENFIYTAEAFDAYLEHLTDNGILNVSRALFQPPRETLRLIATELDALVRRGVAEPFRHLMVLAGHGQNSPGHWAQTLVKRSPFTDAEVDALTAWTESLGFEVLYDPYRGRDNELDALSRTSVDQRAVFIAAHAVNIAPATDDRPFFFQFYRWSDLGRLITGRGGGVRPPLALLILLASLAIIAVLSAAFILYPLYRRGPTVPRVGSAGVFAYFAALGLGFILVEIALLQKLTVFIGGPTYSMSITLATILFASGLGSFVSRRWSYKPLQIINAALPILAGLIVIESLLLDGAIPQMLHLEWRWRVLVVVVLVAPLGLLMGMPFPAGLRHVDRVRPELNAWAWGINAFATVLGSVVCILISASAGFRAALWVGATIYLVGWFAFLVSQRVVRPENSAVLEALP